MNLKKYLQKQAENEAENFLTEEDKQYCMRLAEDVQERPVKTAGQKPKVAMWAGIGSAITVVLVAAIVIPVVLTNNSVNEVHYNDENVEHVACRFEDVNSDLKYFQFLEQENSVFTYELFYDNVSNDHLYYSINVTSVISDFKLYIVVNENYNYEFEFSEELLNEPLNEYTIQYQNKLTDNVGKIEASYIGVIKLKSETVYIEYNQMIDLGKQAFFDDIQSVLKAKK